MRNSAPIHIQPKTHMQSKSVAIKERVRVTSIPLLLTVLLALILSWGAPQSPKALVQQMPAGWVLLKSAVALAFIAWTFYQWRARQMMAGLDLQFKERLSERERISRDLHDTMLQGLLSARMQLCAANDQLPEDSAVKGSVRRVIDLLSRAIDDGRDAIRGLRSSCQSSQDLERAFLQIHEELTAQRDIGGIAFQFLVVGASRPLLPAAHDEVCLIGREALINAVRHSCARKIEIELEYAKKSLRVLIRDNGCGIDPEVLRSRRDKHWGLPGMLERAEGIKAKLTVLSRVGEGTEIELAVPGSVAYDPHCRQPQSTAMRSPGPVSESSMP
jgi:signal transduction histidine kinase